MNVEIANQDVNHVDQVCPSCEVTIQKKIQSRFNSFKVRVFDVIFGMEWLTSYDAHIK